jgi:hypothetical protein
MLDYILSREHNAIADQHEEAVYSANQSTG